MSTREYKTIVKYTCTQSFDLSIYIKDMFRNTRTGTINQKATCFHIRQPLIYHDRSKKA